MYLLNKLKRKSVWKRVFYERLNEPLHLNLISFFVYLFGSYRHKIDFDLIVRQQFAYGILKSAEIAQSHKLNTVSILEFGVASGAGLLNMAKIAARVTKETNVSFKIYGFDTGTGMPPAKDYRDHPELYQEGDFEMNTDKLKNSLPENTTLILGEVGDTVTDFLSKLSEQEPIGFVSIDVDYYHSTKDALKVFCGSPEKYLPVTTVYLDDIRSWTHNSYCGELLAVNEFNCENEFRKIEHHRFFENYRIFTRAKWIKHVYQLHVLDHPRRCNVTPRERRRFLDNPYLA